MNVIIYWLFGAIAKINEIRTKHARLQINKKNGICYKFNKTSWEEVYKFKRGIWLGILLLVFFR